MRCVEAAVVLHPGLPASRSRVFMPLIAQSLATPAPVMPPPMTTASNRLPGGWLLIKGYRIKKI